MHSLLKRQLRIAGFDTDTLPTDLASWQTFLSRIDNSYLNAERNRELIEPQQLMEGGLSAHTIFQTIQDGLCLFDKQGQLVFINIVGQHYLPQAKLRITSLTTLLDNFQLHSRDDSVKVSEHSDIVDIISSGAAIRDSNAWLKQSDENKIPLTAEFSSIKDIKDQTVIGYILHFSGITELKNVENALIAAKNTAEQASQPKSQFLSSMSHELRTPMNAILGYGELLKEDLAIPITEMEADYVDDMQQYVTNILQAGWHLLELINKVLDLTRIEAGKLEVTIASVDIIDLLKDCLNLIKPLAEKRNITSYNTTEALSPTYVLVDKARLKQVIINLLSNAIKYNSEAGSIHIVLDRLKTHHMRLNITDTGKGLTVEQQSKIFEPFTRLENVNLIEGTGIGLTITKRLLEMMDGSIGVESEVNKGSTFWINIPTGKIEHPANEEGDNLNTLAKDKKYTLLYIEDSRTNVSLVAEILKSRPDIALMSAHTGEMGLEVAHLHKPDLILLDINLPGIDGFEVFEALKQDDTTNKIPVLALSANDSVINLDRGKEVGFLEYIVKPLDIRGFLHAIDTAFELREQLRKNE